MSQVTPVALKSELDEAFASLRGLIVEQQEQIVELQEQVAFLGSHVARLVSKEPILAAEG